MNSYVLEPWRKDLLAGTQKRNAQKSGKSEGWETRVFWSSGYYLGVGSKLEMNLICLVVPPKRGNY